MGLRMRFKNTLSSIRKLEWRLYLYLPLLLLVLSACHTSRQTIFDNGRGQSANIHELVRAGIRLGVDVDETDDWPLMLQSAQWMGVRYKFGGNDRNGIDCSGLTVAIFRAVYGINLQRRSIEQYQKNCKPVRAKKLCSGDLVFFANDRNADRINHVGIYLKNDKFLHASTSRGVVVSSLHEDYYKKRFVGGGRVK